MINIGIIGAGDWAQIILEELIPMRGVRVAAVHNRTPEKARALAKRFGISRVEERFEAVCTATDIDAVMVLTHESAHLEPTLCALDHGKHVFVEKPMADAVEAAQRMADRAEQTGLVLMPGHVVRFTAQCRIVKRRLADAGPVRAIRCYQHRAKNLYATYCKPHLALSLMVHHLDLCRWFVGHPVEHIVTLEQFNLGDSYPSSVWATLAFEGGAIATLQSGWVLGSEQPIFWEDGIEIITERDRMTINFHEGCEVRTDRGIEREDISYTPALSLELEYWLKCIEQRTSPTIVTPRDGVEAVALARRVVEAGQATGGGL